MLANSLQITIGSFININKSITYNIINNIWKACIPPKGIRGSNPRLSAFPVKKRKLIMASFFAFITKITGMASHGRTCSVRKPYDRIGKSYALGQPFLLCLLPQT